MMRHAENVVLLRDIPRFPFRKFEDLQRAELRKEIKVGAAMDYSRQWLVSDDPAVPRRAKIKVQWLMASHLFFPAGIILHVVQTGEPHVLWWLGVASLAFLILQPAAVRQSSLLRLVLIFGFLALAASLFGLAGDWAGWLGLSIIYPWLINRTLYKAATSGVITAALSDERLFVRLFKQSIVAISLPDGKQVWAHDCLDTSRDTNVH